MVREKSKLDWSEKWLKFGVGDREASWPPISEVRLRGYVRTANYC